MAAATAPFMAFVARLIVSCSILMFIMAGHISVDDPLEDDNSLMNETLHGFDNIAISNDNLLRPSSLVPASASSTSHLRDALITAPPNALAIRQNNPQDCSNLIAASVDRATVEILRTIIALNATFSQQLNQASISISNVQRSASVATSSAFFSLDLANKAVTTANLALTSAQAFASSAFSSFNSSISDASSSFAHATLALSSSSSSEVLRLSSSLSEIQASLSSAQASASSALASAQSALAAATADDSPGLRTTPTVVLGSPGQNLPFSAPQVGFSIGQEIGIVVGVVLGTVLLSVFLFFIIMKLKSRKERDSYLDEKDAGSPKNLPSRLSSAFRTGNGITIKYNPPKLSEAPQPSQSVPRRPENIQLKDCSSKIKHLLSTKGQHVSLDFGFSEQTTVPAVKFSNSPLMLGALIEERRILRSSLDQTLIKIVPSKGVDLTRDISRQPKTERMVNEDTIFNPFDDPAEIVTRKSISRDNELDKRPRRTKSFHIREPRDPFEKVPVVDGPSDQQRVHGQIQGQKKGPTSERPVSQQPTPPIVPGPRIFAMFQEIEWPRYSTVPEIDRLIRRDAQDNLDIGDGPLFWSDYNAPDSKAEKAMSPSMTRDFLLIQKPLPLLEASAIRNSSLGKNISLSEQNISLARKLIDGDREGNSTHLKIRSSQESDTSHSKENFRLGEDSSMGSNRAQPQVSLSRPSEDLFEDTKMIERELPSLDMRPFPSTQREDKLGTGSPRDLSINNIAPNVELALISLKSVPLPPSHEEQRNRALSPLRRNPFKDVLKVEKNLARRDNSPASPKIDQRRRKNSPDGQGSIAQRQILATGRNNQIRNVISPLAEAASDPDEQPIEIIATDRQARGRSMIRTSDIIEARMSVILRNMDKEEMEVKEESLRESATSPLRHNSVDPELHPVQREAYTEKALSPLRRIPSNGPVSQRSRTLSRKTLEPTSRPASSEDLLPSRERIVPIVLSQQLPSTVAILATSSATSNRPSNALFSQALNKFQAMASENPVNSIAASTEVTQRAIAGIYIPGSLREQAVRNLSKNRETPSRRKSVAWSASQSDGTGSDARDRSLSPLRWNPM